MEWGSVIDFLLIAPQGIVTAYVTGKVFKVSHRLLYSILQVILPWLVYFTPPNAGLDGVARSLLMFAILFGVIKLFSKSPLTHVMMFLAVQFLGQVIIDFVLSILLSVVWGVGILEVTDASATCFLVAKGSATVLMVTWSLVWTYLWEHKIKLKKAPPNSFAFLILIQMVMCLSLFFIGMNVLPTLTLFLVEFVAGGACVWGDMLLLKYIRQLEERNRLDRERQQMEGQLRVQEKHYEGLLHGMEQVRRLRHDVNNQLQTVYALLENGDVALAQTQAKELGTQWDEVNLERYCANHIAEAVFQEKQQVCDQQGITLTVKANLRKNLPIDGVNLCSVLSNILDNGITATKDIPVNQRKIELTASEQAGYLTVVSTNPYVPQMGQPLSQGHSKATGHGYGLEIIKSIAEKYNGRVDFGGEKGLYSITVQVELSDK